ncbi:MAG TPA: TMEM175 family protein [Gaiellaceae bacterium]|nr:TMEM175 family protein [Gaiellaceae bacterium]
MDGTTRLETFSDGVFAIAATLLILDVRLSGHGSVSHQLTHAWPSYAAYAISFATLGIVWVNHHTVFSQIGRVDRTFLFINVLFLMVIAFSPFPTRVLAEHLREGSKAAAFAYGLTYTAMAVCYGMLWFYAAIGRRLIADDADQRTVSGISRSFRPGWIIYTLATLSSLIAAWLAVGLYAAIALFYVLESSLFGRDS